MLATKPNLELPPETTSPIIAAGPEDILIRLDADILPDGDFGHRVLEVTATEIRVFDAEKTVAAPADYRPQERAQRAFDFGRSPRSHAQIRALSFQLSLIR
jgi:hypothetical protein